MTDGPDFLHRTIIRTRQSGLRQALVSGGMTRRSHFDPIVDGRAEPGGTDLAQ